MESTAEISSQGLQTKLELSAEYAELTRTGDATSAETFIANQLVEAVDEGEVDELPGLYAHRAVWRLQLGRASKAEKDLHAALRGHLSPDAAFEVRLLLVECYRAQDRHGEADSALRQAQESLANKPVLSALTLRHMLNVSSGRQASNGLAPEQSGESIASTRSPPMPAPVDQNQQVSANSNGAAAKPKTEAQQPPAKSKKTGSMNSGFFSSSSAHKSASAAKSANASKQRPSAPPPPPAAAPATESAPMPLAPEQVTPNVGASAGPIRADPSEDNASHPVRTRNKRAVITDITASDDQTPASNHNDIEILTNEMDDFNGLGGTVAIMEVDEDELEAALNAPPQYTNSMLPSTQAKLMRVMGTPGACKTRRTPLHACMHQRSTPSPCQQCHASQHANCDVLERLRLNMHTLFICE